MITFYTWSQPKSISHYNSRIWGCSQRFGFSVWRLITFIVNLTRFGVSWPSARAQRFLLSALTYGAQLRPSSGRVRFRDTSDMVPVTAWLHTHYLCFLISKLGKCTQRATQAQRVCVSMQQGRHVQEVAEHLAHKDTLNHQWLLSQHVPEGYLTPPIGHWVLEPFFHNFPQMTHLVKLLESSVYSRSFGFPKLPSSSLTYIFHNSFR